MKICGGRWARGSRRRSRYGDGCCCGRARLSDVDLGGAIAVACDCGRDVLGGLDSQADGFDPLGGGSG